MRPPFRLLLGAAGIVALVLGLLPRSLQESSSSVDEAGSPTRSSTRQFTLGLRCSPIYRGSEVVTEVVTDTGDETTRRRVATQHLSSWGSRIEFASWSAALVVVGGVLLGIALRRRAEPAVGEGGLAVSPPEC